MAEINIQLTPPREGTGRSHLSPASYLTDDDTMKHLKRKSQLTFKSSTAKHLHLDPPPTKDDQTILDYHNRTKSWTPDPSSNLNVKMDLAVLISGVHVSFADLTQARTRLLKKATHIRSERMSSASS